MVAVGIFLIVLGVALWVGAGCVLAWYTRSLFLQMDSRHAEVVRDLLQRIKAPEPMPKQTSNGVRVLPMEQPVLQEAEAYPGADHLLGGAPFMGPR